jgi:hypothetical protein
MPQQCLADTNIYHSSVQHPLTYETAVSDRHQYLPQQCPPPTNICHSSVPQTLTSATVATNAHYHLPQRRPTDTNICYNSAQQILTSATAVNTSVLFTNNCTHITRKIKAVVNSNLLLVYVITLPIWDLKLGPYNYEATVTPTWWRYLVQ